MNSPRRSSRRPTLADTSTDTFASSPGHLPTNRAKFGTNNNGNGQRRFEDFLDSSSHDAADNAKAFAASDVFPAAASSSEADDTFAAAIDKGRKRTADEELRPPPKAKEAAATRAPRKTFNEEADASGFVFTVEPRKLPNASLSNQATASSSASSSMGPPALPTASRIREPLPSDTVGETPINRKNRLFRSGPLHPSTPSSSRPRSGKPPPASRSSSASRRTSLNLKGDRRSSSLRDGTPAYPHPGVPDKELYRHCADNIPPVVRMTHLAAWTLERSRSKVLVTVPSASIGSYAGPKGKRTQKEQVRTQKEQEVGGSSQWTAQERKLLERCRPSVERVLLDTLRDLNGQTINLSWLNVKKDPRASNASTTKRNPRNEENRAISEQLSSLVETLRAENTRWEAESSSVEAFERETAELNRMRSNFTMDQLGSMASSDVTAPPRIPTEGSSKSSASTAGGAAKAVEWDLDDLDEESRAMMRDAQRALAREEGWLPPSSQETELVEVAVRAAAAAQKNAMNGTAGDKRKSRLGASENSWALVEGSEKDARWKDFEFQTDVLHSYTHLLDRLNLLSSSYTSATSSRAAQALHQLAFASGDVLGSSSSASTDLPGSSSAADATADNRAAGRERKEKLLRGIRESIGPVRRLELEAELRARGDEDDEERRLIKGEGGADDDSGIHLADQSAVDLFRAFASGGSTARGRKSGAGLSASRSSLGGSAAAAAAPISGRQSSGLGGGAAGAPPPALATNASSAPAAAMRRTTGRKSRR